MSSVHNSASPIVHPSSHSARAEDGTDSPSLFALSVHESASARRLELPPLEARQSQHELRRFRKRHGGSRMPTAVSTAVLLTRRKPAGHACDSFGGHAYGGYGEKFRETHHGGSSANRPRGTPGAVSPALLRSASALTMHSVSSTRSAVRRPSRPGTAQSRPSTAQSAGRLVPTTERKHSSINDYIQLETLSSWQLSRSVPRMEYGPRVPLWVR